THLLTLWEIAHRLARASRQTPHRAADHRHIRRSRPVYAGYASSRAAVSSSVISPLTSPRSSAARIASTLVSPRAAATTSAVSRGGRGAEATRSLVRPETNSPLE